MRTVTTVALLALSALTPRLVSLQAQASEVGRPLGRLVDVYRRPWGKLVIREEGIEWHGLFGERFVHYDAVSGYEYRDRTLTVWAAGKHVLSLSYVSGGERVWRILSNRNVHQR